MNTFYEIEYLSENEAAARMIVNLQHILTLEKIHNRFLLSLTNNRTFELTEESYTQLRSHLVENI